MGSMRMGIDDGNGNVIYDTRRYLEQLREKERQEQIDFLRADAERLRREAESAGNWADFLGHAAEFWDGFFGMATPTYSLTIAVLRRLGAITQAQWSSFSQPSAYRAGGQAIGLMVAFLLPTRAVASRQIMWVPGTAAFTQGLAPGATALIQILLPGGLLLTYTEANAYNFCVALLTAMGQANNAF